MPYRINPFTGNPDYYDPSSGGTVTSVASGTGLTGGPITTTGTLSVDSATVPYYAGGPGSAGFVKWNGTAWAIDTTSYVNKAGDTMTGYLTLNAAPTSSLHAATKQYVDNIATGINFHAPVVAATTGPLPAVTYNNAPDPLNPGVGATLIATSPGALTIDTVTFSGGGTERVLIKNQVSGVENGIYVVNIAGNAITPFQLTRATDADNSPTGELAFGDFCFVEQGPTNGSFGYILNTPGTITVGVTPLSYVIFNAAQVVTAGTGLLEATPNVLSIDTTKVPYYSGVFLAGFAKWDGSNWVFDTSTYLDTTTAASTYLTIANAITTYYPLSSNPAGYITSGSLSGYVPFTGATSNVNLGAFSLTAAGVNISGLTTGSVLFAGASGALSQDNANFFWDDSNNRLGIGNNTPTEALTVTGNMLLNLTGSTSVKIYNVTGINTYESAGPTLISSTGSNYVNIKAGGDFAIQTNGSGANKLVISTSNSIGNTTTQFNSTLFAQANCQASTEVRSVLFSGIGGISPIKTWLNGNINTQRWFHITANTAAFQSAPSSTITNSYALYVEAAIAGTNAIITNNYALGLKGQFFADLDGTGKTLIFKESSLYASYGWQIATSNDKLTIPQQIWLGDSSALINRFTAGGGNYGLLIESFKDIKLSSMSPVNTFLYCVGNTGHVGIGTTTPSERLTISGGNILLQDAGNFIVGTITGTKIGTATTQKLGFFNATPIVQPAAVTTVQGLADALGSATGLGLIATSVITLPVVIQAACSDETSNLTTGTAKVTFRMPHAMTLTAIRASLTTAQASGTLVTVDVNLNGVSVLGTKLTFNNTQTTTTTATTPATIVTSALTDDGEITVDIDAIGAAGAKGLKITLIGTRV